MLFGEYQHAMDPKGRLFMPAKFREVLGESFYLSKGLDNCIAVYSSEEWQVFHEKLSEQPMSQGRDLQRFFFSGAAEVTPDKQGRILVPASLRSYAMLENEAVIIGASNRAEIWDPDRWQQRCGALTSDFIAESMSELGF
jgi:MraZ protein